MNGMYFLIVINQWVSQEPVVLADIDLAKVYNYDEVNVTDNPRLRCIECVQEHSKMAISITVCGNANGDLLFPFVVYKTMNYYEGWIINCPKVLSTKPTRAVGSTWTQLISGFLRFFCHM